MNNEIEIKDLTSEVKELFIDNNKSFELDKLGLNSSSNIKYFFTNDNKKIIISIEQKKSIILDDQYEVFEHKILVIDIDKLNIISCFVVDNLQTIWILDNSTLAFTLSDSNELFVYDFYQKQLKQVIDLKFYNQEDNGFDSFYAQDVFKINSNAILISDRINSITKIYDLVNGSENQYNFSISLSKNISLEEKSLLLDFDFSKLENIYTEYKNSYLILELITPNYFITSNLSGKIVIWDKYFQKISTIYENDIEISQFYTSKDYASHGISKINDNLICLWGQAKNYSEKSLKLYELNTGVCKNIIISSPVFRVLPVSSDTFIFYTSDSIIFQNINSKKSFFSYDYSIRKNFDIDKEKILILTKEEKVFLLSKNPSLNFISSFEKADFYYDDNFDYTNNWSIELLDKTFYIQKQTFIEDEIPNVPKYKTSFYFNSKYNEIIISNLDRRKYFHISKVEPNLDIFCLPLFKDIPEIKNLFLIDNKIIIIDSKNKLFIFEKNFPDFSNNLISNQDLFVDVSINDFTNTEKEILLGKEKDLKKFESKNNIYETFMTCASLGDMYFDKDSPISIEKSIFYYEKAKDIIENISKMKNIVDVINTSLAALLKMAEEKFLEESKYFRDDITEEEIENSRKIRVNEFMIRMKIISLYLNLSTSYQKNNSGDPLRNLLLSENILLELKNYDDTVELQSNIILIGVYIQISEIFKLKNDFESSFLYQEKAEEIMKSLPSEKDIQETLKIYFEEGCDFIFEEEDSYTFLEDEFYDDLKCKELSESSNDFDKLIEFNEKTLNEMIKFSFKYSPNQISNLHKDLAELYTKKFENEISNYFENNKEINENNFPIIKTIHYHYKRALKHQSFIIKKLNIYNNYSSFISLIKPSILIQLLNTESNDINLIENQKVLKEAINISEKYRSNILSPEEKKIFQDLCSVLFKKIIKNTNELLKESKRNYLCISHNSPFDINKYELYISKHKEYKEDLFKYIEMSKTRSLVDVINSKNEGRIVFDESIANDNPIIIEEIKLLDKLEDEIANNEKSEIDKSSDSNNTRGFRSEIEVKKTTEEIKLLESRKNELEKQKRELLDKLYKYPHIKARLSQINGEVISLNQLQSLLGNQISDDTAIFQYYLSDEIFITNVITKDKVETIVEENSFKHRKLNYWIKLYNECFEMFCPKDTLIKTNKFTEYINKIKNDYHEIADYKGTKDDFNNFVLDLLGKELYKYLVEPAEEFIKDKKRLMFISQSYLHNFAFNILQKDNRFLIDTMELYKLPSASIWESLKYKSGFNFENITAFAVSEYIDKEKENKINLLKGSKDDIDTIKGNFENNDFLHLNLKVEDEVKPEIMKKYMKDANILSLSGHGYSEKDDSGYIYIDKKAEENLYLSISKIFSSFPSFEKNSLVVLSICHGGFQILTGEEISGINSVFLMLGAGAVISNLVPLFDTVGAEFSKLLYSKIFDRWFGYDEELEQIYQKKYLDEKPKDKLEIFYESLRELKIKNDGIENWAFLEFQGNPDF